MNYNSIYAKIVLRAQTRYLTGYVERHHIVPKCMGGSNQNTNIVKLTAKEHYICHKLLHYMYPESRSLARAYYAMCVLTTKSQGRVKPSARTVEEAKIANSLSRRGIPKSKTAIEKRTKSRLEKGNYVRSEQAIRKGIETRKKNGTLSYGPFSDEHRKKLSESKKKAIQMFSLDYQYITTYTSASEAARRIGGHVSGISKAALKILGDYRNSRWKYVD